MKNSTLKSVISKTLWILAFALPVLLTGSWFLAKKVRTILIEELNKNLTVHVTIHSLDISLWSNFPNINLRASGIQIKESLPFYHLNAIEADELSLVFNIWEVIKEQTIIDKIKLKGANLRLYKGKYGVNYNFFKEQPDSSKTPLAIELKKIQFENCKVWYIDEIEQHSANFESKKLLASGKLSEEKFSVNMVGDALFDHLKINGSTLFKGKKVFVETAVEVNNKIGSYHVEKGLLRFSDLELDVKGDLMMAGKYPDIDMEIKGRNMQLNSLLSLFPNKGFAGLKHENSSGTMFLQGKIQGRMTEEEWPNVEVKFGGDKVAYAGDDANIDLNDLSFEGSFVKNDKIPEGLLKTNIKSLQIGKGNLSGSLELRTIQNPVISITSKGTLNLEELKKVIHINELLDWNGNLRYNVKTEISMSHQGEKWQYALNDLDGDLILDNGMVLLRKDSLLLSGLQTSVTFRNKDLLIESIYAKWKENDALIKGTWHSFIPWMQDSSKLLSFSGSLVSQNLDLNQIDKSFSSSGNEENQQTPLNLSVDMVVGKLAWRKHLLNNIKGNLIVSGEDISLTGLNFKTMDGNIQADFAIETTENEQSRMRLKMTTQHVNITTLFERFNNFEQSEITSKHLEGYLDAEIVYEHLFDSKGKIDMSSVTGLGIVEIKKGRLKNYEPLLSLSKFVDIKELKDIKFSDLKNTIEIKDQLITIPHMKIENNALNLEVSGTHSFDNVLDYNIKIFLSDLLAAKYDWVKRKKEKKVDQEKGGLSAYIHMVGPSDDLKITYDKKNVSKKIKEEVKNERKSFFEAIKSDFKGIEPIEVPTEAPTESIWDE